MAERFASDSDGHQVGALPPHGQPIDPPDKRLIP